MLFGARQHCCLNWCDRLLIIEEGKGRSRNKPKKKSHKYCMIMQIAFIGFAAEDEAQAAKNYLNKTFIDTSKIEVQFAWGIQETEKESRPRPWSRYSQGSSAYVKVSWHLSSLLH